MPLETVALRSKQALFLDEFLGDGASSDIRVQVFRTTGLFAGELFDIPTALDMSPPRCRPTLMHRPAPAWTCRAGAHLKGLHHSRTSSRLL
jgi:hypothetical protein